MTPQQQATLTVYGVSVTREELLAIAAKARGLSQEEHDKLTGALTLLGDLGDEVARNRISSRRLRRMLFGPTSEKSNKILKGDGDDNGDGDGNGDENGDENENAAGDDAENDSGTGSDKGTGSNGRGGECDKKNRKGHGRRPLEDYTGASRIFLQHETLKPRDPCPEIGCEGRVYELKPVDFLKFVGQAALLAVIYQFQRFRCGLCGKTFTASLPEGVGKKKYDVTAIAMLALLRYGYGVPLNRLAKLQENLGIPLPPSNQWEAVAGVVPVEVYDELKRQAAQAKIIFIDDTTMRILELEIERRALEEAGEELKRTGIFTSGIVSETSDKRRIALFFTGRRHAGENTGEVLSQRDEELEPPIQMSDALSRNAKHDAEVIHCNCLAHGRREFVDLIEDFPEECGYVIKILREVYKRDGEARKADMTAEERLEHHRLKSKRLMARLRLWMWRQFKERLVEPNSGLGQAIQYMRNHWRKLTRFLFVPGAPVDNNLVERSLKMAICHRKNSLFYKSENGARVGDVYMSLIETCKLSGANAFDYLVEIQRNAAAVAREPASWMPWNYRETLKGLKGAGADPPTTEKSAS